MDAPKSQIERCKDVTNRAERESWFIIPDAEEGQLRVFGGREEEKPVNET